MTRTVGIAPGFLAKLDTVQKSFILTAVGRRFYDEFLCAHGYHIFIFGITGCGKTNKGYWLVDWLKHLETQVWISSGKSGETIPLLMMGKKVRVIVPTGTDVVFEELKNGRWSKLEDHPEIVQVETPRDMLMAITAGSWSNTRHLIRDTINILEIRTAFKDTKKAILWVAEMFECLAEMLRDGELHGIDPVSLHIDESQWTIAGKRISNDPERMKASEKITENALELRSAGWRLCIYAQGHNNIPPPARENMLFHVLCKGADVSADEDPGLAEWCKFTRNRDPPSPQQFKTAHGRFVFENRDSWPKDRPWKFRRYPLQESDRDRLSRIRVRYVGKHDMKTEADEVSEELMPDLGRYSAMAIRPEKHDGISLSLVPAVELKEEPQEINYVDVWKEKEQQPA